MNSYNHVESKTVVTLNYSAGENAREGHAHSRHPQNAISASECRRDLNLVSNEPEYACLY
jgi:hypothetical protein